MASSIDTAKRCANCRDDLASPCALSGCMYQHLAKDAERYRWLRGEVESMQGMEWMNYMRPEKLDATIDNAIIDASK